MVELIDIIEEFKADDEQRELLIKIDRLRKLSRIRCIRNVPFNNTRDGLRLIFRFYRETKELQFMLHDRMYWASLPQKNVGEAQSIIADLSEYIQKEKAKGTKFI